MLNFFKNLLYKQEISRAAVARKYGVAAQMIREWEKQYKIRGEDGLISRDNIRNKYTGEFRVQVIWELRHEFKIMVLIEVSGLPRSSYYYYAKQKN